VLLAGNLKPRKEALKPTFKNALVDSTGKKSQITSVELQVVARNPDGIGFYRQLGWHEELLQMVWDTTRR
jgi:hypothetical protein